MNKKLMITRPELHPVPVKSAWYHIGMDFVGPIHPMTHNGNQFILTICDYFSKFGWQWRSQTFPDDGAQSFYRILSMITHKHAGSYVHLLKVVDCMENA